MTELNYIDISTLLGQNTVTEGCYKPVTTVTKSLDQIMSRLLNIKNMFIKIILYEKADRLPNKEKEVLSI